MYTTNKMVNNNGNVDENNPLVIFDWNNNKNFLLVISDRNNDRIEKNKKSIKILSIISLKTWHVSNVDESFDRIFNEDFKCFKTRQFSISFHFFIF
jgi:hypothetical protein